MALKYRIQTITSVPVYTGTEVTGFTNYIDGIASYTYNTSTAGVDFVLGDGTGFIEREQILFILPYDDGIV